MAFQGGGPRAPAAITVAQIKNAGDLSFMRIDKANVQQHVFPNALINASFDFWQRGTSFSFGAGTGVYGPDRWNLLNLGPNGTGTMVRQALAFGDWPGSQSRYGCVFGISGHSAVSDVAFFGQPIEGVDTYAGKRVIIQGGIKVVSGAVGSKVACEIQQSFGTGGSADTFTYAGQITLTSALTKFALVVDVPSMSGKVIGSAGDFVKANFFLSAGSNFNARTGNLGLQSISVMPVDVECKEIKPGYGDQAPGFERIPMDLDYYRAMRFYERVTGGVLGFATAAGQYFGGRAYFKAPKRINPNVSFVTAVSASNTGGPYVETSSGVFGESFALTVQATASGTFAGHSVFAANAEY